jgi:hypothetical protein
MSFYQRRIKCPRHHVVKPGKQPFLITENELVKDTKMSDADIKRFGLRRWKYKRDKFGNKIPDFRNHYQPEISAAFALEAIYDPVNPICARCKRCMEGFGSAYLIGGKNNLNDGRTIADVTAEMLKGSIK